MKGVSRKESNTYGVVGRVPTVANRQPVAERGGKFIFQVQQLFTTNANGMGAAPLFVVSEFYLFSLFNPQQLK